MAHLRKLNYLPYLPWPKQVTFLSYMGQEAFFGGAAGPGKSSALLMAAVFFATEKNYAALLLRRTFPELSKAGAIMERAHEWWEQVAKWNGGEKKWTFPSGATITFGYLEKEADKYQYLSSEFNFIGFDELTGFTETQYTYLFSRLRRTIGNPIPLRMRSASNPGNAGMAWVKRRFLTRPEGRVFIPAALTDNPAVDAKEYAASLANLDPVTRRQMLEGDWTDPEGGRFKAEWLRYYSRLPASQGAYVRVNGDLLPLSQLKVFLTLDAASTVKETASRDDPDYTVISAWGITPRGLLLWLGCRRLRIELPDIPRHVADLYAQHRAGKVYAEGGGLQKGVPQLLKRQRLPNGAFMNVLEWNPQGKGDKLERSAPAQNLAEAGRLYLPLDVPDFPLEEVRAEVVAFTGDDKQDAHDDVVDTLSIACWVADGMPGLVQRGRVAFRPFSV